MCKHFVGRLQAGVLIAAGGLAGSAFGEESPGNLGINAAADTARYSYETPSARARYSTTFAGETDVRRLALKTYDRDRSVHLSNRLSVGRTFDGFGIRWDLGDVQLALTNDGVGAHWAF